MPTHHAVDFYRISSLLTEEEKQFQETVGDFVDKQCMPLIADH